MLKQTVTYTDFDDMPRTETLYFNITKTELMDMLDLQPRLEAWQNRTKTEDGEDRQLEPTEIMEMLDIIKVLMDKSYGVRSDDGKLFRKSPEILSDFKSSAAYDAFLFSMFEDPTKAVTFMLGIVPKGLVDDKTVAEARKSSGLQEAPLPEQVTDLSATQAEVPAWVREDREPTPAEMASMGREELLLAFKRKTAQPEAPTE